jgi:hypothetical protein
MPNDDFEKLKEALPSRRELAAKSLFAATAEEREIASRLLSIVPKSRAGEHPRILLDRLHAAGTQGESDYLASPLGQLIEDIVNSQDEELGSEDAALTSILDKVPSLPLPPKAPEVPVAEEPLGASLRKLVEPRNPIRQPPPLPSWTKAEPLPPEDFDQQHPMVW